MIYKSGTVLFSGCYCSEHIEAGKQYMAANNLTPDNVQCLGNEKPPFGEVLIIAKKDVELIA